MNWWRRLTGFLTDVRSELRKTTWPSWIEVRGTTIVVIVTSAIFSVFLWLVDMVLARLVATIMQRLAA